MVCRPSSTSSPLRARQMIVHLPSEYTISQIRFSPLQPSHADFLHALAGWVIRTFVGDTKFAPFLAVRRPTCSARPSTQTDLTCRRSVLVEFVVVPHCPLCACGHQVPRRRRPSHSAQCPSRLDLTCRQSVSVGSVVAPRYPLSVVRGHQVLCRCRPNPFHPTSDFVSRCVCIRTIRRTVGGTSPIH
jgi:hypothetical protein